MAFDKSLVIAKYDCEGAVSIKRREHEVQVITFCCCPVK